MDEPELVSTVEITMETVFDQPDLPIPLDPSKPDEQQSMANGNTASALERRQDSIACQTDIMYDAEEENRLRLAAMDELRAVTSRDTDLADRDKALMQLMQFSLKLSEEERRRFYVVWSASMSGGK